MFCKRCGTKLQEGDVFCSICGERQTPAPAVPAQPAVQDDYPGTEPLYPLNGQIPEEAPGTEPLYPLNGQIPEEAPGTEPLYPLNGQIPEEAPGTEPLYPLNGRLPDEPPGTEPLYPLNGQIPEEAPGTEPLYPLNGRIPEEAPGAGPLTPPYPSATDQSSPYATFVQQQDAMFGAERLSPNDPFAMTAGAQPTAEKAGKKGKKKDKKKKKKKGKIVLIVLLALILALAGTAAALHFTGVIDLTRIRDIDLKSFFSGNGLFKETVMDAAFYVKDGELYVAYSGKKDIETKKLTSDYLTADYEDSDNYEYYGSTPVKCVFNQTKKRILFPDYVSEDMTCTLYYMDLDVKKSEDLEKVKIAENVSAYYVADDGEKAAYVVKTEDGSSLYTYDFSGKKLVTENMSACRFNNQAGTLVYTEKDEGTETYVYYYADTSGESTRIGEGTGSFLYEDTENNILCFADGNKIYTVKDGKNATEICDCSVLKDANSFDIEYADESHVYFTVSFGYSTKFVSLIEDPNVNSDRFVSMPDRNNQKYWAEWQEGWGGDPYPTAYTDAYYEEETAYKEAQMRIALREYTSEMSTYDIPDNKLYYATGGKYQEVAAHVSTVDYFNGYIVYTTVSGAEEKLNFADFARTLTEDDLNYQAVKDSFTKALQLRKTGYLVVRGESVPFAEAPQFDADGNENRSFTSMSVDIDPKGTAVYYIAELNKSGNGTLCKRFINDAVLEDSETVYESVCAFFFAENGDLYTFRNTKAVEDSDVYVIGEIYCNSKLIATDVAGVNYSRLRYAMFDESENGDYYNFATDLSVKDYTLTLRQYNGSDTVSVAKNAYHLVDLGYNRAFYTDLAAEDSSNTKKAEEDTTSAAPEEEPDEVWGDEDEETAETKYYRMWYVKDGEKTSVESKIDNLFAGSTN